MKFMTGEWLKAANDDLLVIKRIIDEESLTHIVSFHAEQVVEKVLKALLEEQNSKIPKTHDIRRLHKMVETLLPLNEESLEILLTINELYIDSRYPVDFGLLPDGKPSLDDAKIFHEFAEELFDRVCAILNVDKTEIIKR